MLIIEYYYNDNFDKIKVDATLPTCLMELHELVAAVSRKVGIEEDEFLMLIDIQEVDKSMITPLKCLCGKLPTVLPVNSEIAGNAWGEVRCDNPTCPAKPRIYDGEECADERGSDEYKRIAIERWNKWISGNWKDS